MCMRACACTRERVCVHEIERERGKTERER